MKLSISSVFVVFLLSIQVCYASHPAEGLEPTLPPNVDDISLLPAEWSMGDITFIPRDEWPDYRNLTPLEQYMLFGAASPDGSGEVVLNAWSESVFAAAVKFYTEYGYIPAVLDANNLRMIPNYEEAQGDFLDIYRNPLTGAWPRLDAVDPSPGDLYIRVLTEEEMRHFAEFRLWYEKHWIEHKAMDYEASPELPMQERYTVDIELTSPVIYLRYYGYNGVLSNGFKYIYKRLD